MKRILFSVACVALLGAITTSPTGCAKSTESGAQMSLFNQLGGAETVNRLAEGWSSKLLADPRISKFLTQDSAKAVSNGLVNEISKISGMAPPTSDNLLDTLRAAQLDKPAVESLTENLDKTATELNISKEGKQGLMSVLEPVTESLMTAVR